MRIIYKCLSPWLPKFTLLILLFISPLVNAQQAETYKVWVTLVNQSKVKGLLYSASENELVILDAELRKRKFVPEDIKEIKIRREGKIGKSAWIGAASGFVVNAALVVSDEWYDGIEGEAILIGGITTGALGAVIGMAVGSGKKKFVINSDKHAYESRLPELQKYTPH